MPKQKVYDTRAIYFTNNLKRKISKILDYPCTLVEAPMGYGKTTAVREYLKSTNANVLWHRVYDSSTSGFWITFSRLFYQLNPTCSIKLEQFGFPNDNVSMQEVLKFITEIQFPAETVLVIDDYHLVSATEVSNFVWFLIVNEIDHLHIVLTARFVERLKADELALKGYLYHIEKEDLELNSNEILEYYRLCGISLRETESDQLYAITEGWISALYLLLLSVKETGSIEYTNNIQKLVENAVYAPFSEEMKLFLLCLCLFESFTMKQAIHMWGDERARLLLTELRNKNAFVNFDPDTKTYQIHHIFTYFLRELLKKRDSEYTQKLYEKAGHWCLKKGDYFAAMQYFFTAGDFENLLSTVELDRASSFENEQKAVILQYFEQCPPECKKRHPVAILIFAMAFMTFNEMELFQKTCNELTLMIKNSDMNAECMNALEGELELLLSFTRYNDIMGMSEYHKRACMLLKQPSVFMDTTGSWTFGSPSVLYMFYRERGKLEQAVREIKECMPYYYQVTDGHGTGAEYLMEAEWHFNKGDFKNAEIAMHRAFYLAEGANQPNIIICALFLQSRMALMRGDYADVLEHQQKIKEIVEEKKLYTLIHTVDMCKGFIASCLQQTSLIPEWLVEGDFSSSRLFFAAKAFYNIIYGRSLLLKGDYLKLLGISGQFIEIASVFPYVLPKIYTALYVGAANQRIYRKEAAITAVKEALFWASPDKVYMPFVENCDYMMPLLEVIYNEGVYRKDIERIWELSSSYQDAVEQIKRTYFQTNKPKLTEREIEIARLAGQGFSNKQIGENLFITENTVKKHLKSVFEKLEMSSRTQLQHFDFTGSNLLIKVPVE